MNDETKPRRTARKIDAESVHQSERVLPASGDIPDHDSTIERVTDMSTVTEKAETLAFMEEPVEVMIHESTDTNAEKVVFVSVNGKGAGPLNLPWIPRGMAVTIKRKFVERLARAKRVGIKTEEVRDHNNELTTAIRRSSALAYPFSVLSDRNPQGASWLQRVLAEA